MEEELCSLSLTNKRCEKMCAAWRQLCFQLQLVRVMLFSINTGGNILAA